MRGTTELMHGLAFRCLASAWSLPRPLSEEDVASANRLIDVGDSATLRALDQEDHPVSRRRRRIRIETRAHWFQHFTRLGRTRVASGGCRNVSPAHQASATSVSIIRRLGAECDLKGWELMRFGVGRPARHLAAQLRIKKRTAERRELALRLIGVGTACQEWLKKYDPTLLVVAPSRDNPHPNVAGDFDERIYFQTRRSK